VGVGRPSLSEISVTSARVTQGPSKGLCKQTPRARLNPRSARSRDCKAPDNAELVQSIFRLSPTLFFFTFYIAMLLLVNKLCFCGTLRWEANNNNNLIYVFGERGLLPFSWIICLKFLGFGHFAFSKWTVGAARIDSELRLVSASATTGLFLLPAARLPLGRRYFSVGSILFVAEGSWDAAVDAGSAASGSAGRTASDSISQPKSQSHWFHSDKNVKKERSSRANRLRDTRHTLKRIARGR